MRFCKPVKKKERKAVAMCIAALTYTGNQNSHMVVCANPTIALSLYAFTKERVIDAFVTIVLL